MVYRGVYSLVAFQETRQLATELPHLHVMLYIKTSGSESRPRKVELASAHKKRDDYRKYFTHNNEACKNPYKTTLPHLYIH